jgi:hypothetical protein
MFATSFVVAVAVLKFVASFTMVLVTAAMTTELLGAGSGVAVGLSVSEFFLAQLNPQDATIARVAVNEMGPFNFVFFIGLGIFYERTDT